MARLFQSGGVEEQWEAVAGPWLRREVRAAWEDRRPTVVLTPSRAESFYLRERMVAEGLSFFGLRFWTPSDARNFLAPAARAVTESGTASSLMAVAEESELRLLARMGAERLAEKSDEPSLTSARRDPRLFLRAYELLLGAGWDPAKEGAEYGRGLARELGRLLKERGLTTQAGLHRVLRERVVEKGARLRRLLVCGFNGTHWPLWDLLLAVVGSAEEAEVSLLSPLEFGKEVDVLWIGSWEEELGQEVQQVGGVAEGPLAKWVGSYERGVMDEAEDADFSFLAAADLPRMAEGIVGQALVYLAQPSCERLGIVFPEANALALEVARRLRELGVPLDDGTGFWRLGARECRTWGAWLELQEDPCVERLAAWMRAAEADGLEFGTKLPARTVAEALDGALGETLIDRLDFLRLHLEEKMRGKTEVGKFLRERVQLPESGTLGDFLALTEKAVRELDWGKRLRWDELAVAEWMREGNGMVSRGTFLEWLRDAGDSRERGRSAEGNHFYGRVHLRIYAQMPGQTWSHLILTGLNEGRWPRMSESGAFGSRHELAALNRQARGLNRRGQMQGGQGEGHEAMRPGHGHCLLPLERYDLAVRDLCLAVEATSEAVCLAAMTAERGRALLPSDFFAQAYQAKSGRVLDEVEFSDLGRRAVARVAEKKVVASHKNIEATAEAYAARRKVEVGYGRWEFSFAEPPARPVQLPCKAWEDAWKHPAAVWLARVVGAKGWPEGEMAWRRAVGTWVHGWLAAALTEGRNGHEALTARLRGVAEAEARDMRARLERAQAEAYPWWQSVWEQARGQALNLAEALGPLLQGKAFLSEYRLPGLRSIALPGTEQADFEINGRIDLLLLEGEFDAARGDFNGCAAQVVDFKTGSAKALTPDNVAAGNGLQAMLYALAVRAAGAVSVGARLQTGEVAKRVELQIEQIEANVALFRSLDRLHRQGIFGMREEKNGDYGYVPDYPLATLRIDKEILKAKWALTHGAAELGGGEGGDE